MKPYLPLNIGVNPNDRVDALLDMGVSPGEDDSYEVQARRLIRQKDKLIDNTKRNVLDRLESMIQTSRHAGPSTEGVVKPLDFAAQVLAKSIPAPSELNPNNIIKAIPELASGALEVAKHPLASLKQTILNGPPEPSTLAALVLPGAALKAYRELTPLATRTYLHHVAGVPTPFTHVTEAERMELTKLAQNKIDDLLDTQKALDTVKAHALKQINNIKLMTDEQLETYAKYEYGTHFYNDYLRGESTKDIRDILIYKYKRKRTSIFSNNPTLKAHGYLGSEEANANVRKDFQDITGKKLNATPVESLDDYATAFGKTYVEPMIDKATGKVVPKAIKDTYKFYPDVYEYREGQGRYVLKTHIKDMLADLKDPLYKGDKIQAIKDALRNILRVNMNDPLGIFARKIGMRRPTSIIDIPLMTPAPMNAYDKAAILLASKQLAKKKE